MKVKSVKLNLAILALLILGGCASNNKFASRKYTKGYYVDFVSKQKAEPRITRNENTTTQVIPVKQELKAITPIAANNVNTILKTHPLVGGKPHLYKPIAVKNQKAAYLTACNLLVNQLPDKPISTDPVSDPRQKGNAIAGTIFVAIGSILLLLGLLSNVFLAPVAEMVLGGLLILIGACMIFIPVSNNPPVDRIDKNIVPQVPSINTTVTSPPTDNANHVGSNKRIGSFFLEIGCMFAIVAMLSGGIGLPAGIYVLFSIVFIVAALVLLLSHGKPKPSDETNGDINAIQPSDNSLKGLNGFVSFLMVLAGLIFLLFIYSNFINQGP